MNTSRFSMAVSCLALFSHLSIFGMITYKNLADPDIRQNIYEHLSKEDQDDFRLVCKDWACKGNIWKFMPDVIEKEHNRYTKNGRHLTSWDKTYILFDFTSMNDLASVQWIKNNTKTHSDIDITIDEIDNNIHAVMFAIHNKNPEVARFLIETDKKNYPDNNWKTYYKNITLPNHLQKYFDQTHPHDFSILAYFLTIWTDNSHELKQLLCLQNMPNTDGTTRLIIMSIAHNALNCFKTFLKNDQIKNIIYYYGGKFFNLAKEHNRTMIMELIRHNKMIDHHPTNNNMHNDYSSWCTIL